MKKKNIIKSKLEYTKIIKNCKYKKNNYFVIYYCKTTKNNRYGISVPKKIGKAYLRNKIKTLIENSYNNCIMHMDFRFGNLMFRGNDISVIDFESTKNGDHVFDFVRDFSKINLTI